MAPWGAVSYKPSRDTFITIIVIILVIVDIDIELDIELDIIM